MGGPILRDRVWFFGNTRAIGTYQEQQNLYANQNAGDPNAWTWVQTTARGPQLHAKTLNAVRLTWQATQKNKVGFYIDYTKNCSGGAYTEGGDQCRAPGRRLGRVGSRRDAGHGHRVARVWLDLGRAGEDHADVVDVAVLESRAPRERLFVVLHRQR